MTLTHRTSHTTYNVHTQRDTRTGAPVHYATRSTTERQHSAAGHRMLACAAPKLGMGNALLSHTYFHTRIESSRLLGLGSRISRSSRACRLCKECVTECVRKIRRHTDTDVATIRVTFPAVLLRARTESESAELESPSAGHGEEAQSAPTVFSSIKRFRAQLREQDVICNFRSVLDISMCGNRIQCRFCSTR